MKIYQAHNKYFCQIKVGDTLYIVLAVENKYQKQITIEKEPFLRELLKGLHHNEIEKMKTYTASDVLNILERLQELYKEEDYLKEV